MAQLSRPYQIALAAVAVLGLVWAVALRAHGPSPSPSEPAPTKATAAATSSAGAASASSSTNAAAEAKAAAAPTPIYHGAAPGVEGLTRAIAKAHAAVATSQRNAQELQHKSGEASEETQTPATTSSAGASSATAQKSLTVAHHRTVTRTTANGTVTKTHERVVSKVGTQNAAKAHPGRSAQQIAVEAELARGKTVMLVFWDPKSSVDREVLLQADALAGGSKGAVTVHAALANQVGLFGKITEVVHVYQTPTILIVNRQGVVSTLTGLTDVFSLQQAVREAREARS